MAKSLKASVLRRGSDFLDEDSKMCDPCSVDGQSNPADRFCVDCHEYYCTKCTKHHFSLGMLRKHTLLTLDAVNKTTMRVIKDKCSEKCTVHTDKTIKWYCEAHSSLVCSVCNGTDHKRCSNTSYIPTAAADIENNGEFKMFDGNLRAIEKAFKAGIEEVDSILKHIAADETKIKNAFKTFRKRLSETVDQLEHDTTAEARKIAREETKKLKDLSKGLETSLDEVVGLVKNVDDLLKTGKHCDVFVTMKKQCAQLVRLNGELETMTRGKNFCRYEFQPNEDIMKQANLGKLISQTATIDWRAPIVPALKQTPQQAEQKPQRAERAVQKTVQTENVSRRGRNQRPQPVDWEAMAMSMKVGDRVRRGRNWPRGNDEDGGGLGTVVRHVGQDYVYGGYPSWEVSWDCGTRGTYGMGTGEYGSLYQLEIV